MVRIINVIWEGENLRRPKQLCSPVGRNHSTQHGTKGGKDTQTDGTEQKPQQKGCSNMLNWHLSTLHKNLMEERKSL